MHVSVPMRYTVAGLSAPLPSRFTRRKETSCPLNRRVGWASPSVCLGLRNLAPTAFRTPDLPTRTESPYRLRYSGAHT
jgi:hypothetical protein